MMADIESNNLKAAMTIAALFERATVLGAASALVEKALQRMPVGIPPGSVGFLGDAIGWELMLRTVPQREAIFFMADDKDFLATLDGKCVKESLGEESESAK
jgi:hypothetical protein